MKTKKQYVTLIDTTKMKNMTLIDTILLKEHHFQHRKYL
jgi:hypothetical protein